MNFVADMRTAYERLTLKYFLPLVVVIFTASGFAGLIYESIWSHYLKLFLGHAAYAQTLVLAIFMGGMAIGAWLASLWSRRLKDLLLAYAVVEAVIGITSLIFHGVFVETTALMFDRIIPALAGSGAADVVKWSVAATLILPQSMLLGATFPLLTGGALRIGPGRDGYTIAMLYFANSLGAAMGVLASGFYFIEAVGLPGTLVAAAIVNLAVALAVMLLPRAGAKAGAALAAEGGDGSFDAQPSTPTNLQRLLLVVAALTGLSSFMYEIGWIRMLSLVLGSSTHAFELMLSAFVLGIALGGLWVRRRIESAGSTVALLGSVQVAMGIAAMATLPVYGSSFHVMQWIIAAAAPSEPGYTFFNFASHGIALAIMFPAAFFAGMTLPLITASLLRMGAGEPALGKVYAANTAGAILGVVLAVHVGLPWLGVKGLIIAGAVVDLALGVMLLGARARETTRRFLPAAAVAVSVAAVAWAIFGVELRTLDMGSGVYRQGRLLDPQRTQIVSYEDGKTSTVAISATPPYIALHTNGKPDGTARVEGDGPISGDEATMTLIGALPLLSHPKARSAAVIGFGTGIGTHVLLSSPRLETVDTIEIEPAVVRASRRFRPLNARAYDDPRSHIHYEDAKTYFSSTQRRYDLIVSEPSNPWVSGVSTLFSVEFYRDIRKYLADGGVLVQWIQAYEMTPQLVASILDALGSQFPDYVLWTPNDSDFIIVAARDGRVRDIDASLLASPALAADLRRILIRSPDDLLLHRIAGRRTVGPYFSSWGAPLNSDFYPFVDLNATKARFMHQSVADIAALRESPVPVLDLFEGREAARSDARNLTPGARPWLRRAGRVRDAAAAAEFLRSGDVAVLRTLDASVAEDAISARAALVSCANRPPGPLLRDELLRLASLVNPNQPPREAARGWAALAASKCPVVDASIRDWIRLHEAIGGGDGRAMARAAEAVLKSDGALADAQTPYVVAALMMGRLLEGDRVSALRSYAHWRPRLTSAEVGWRPVFRLILSQTDRAVAK